MNNSMVAHLWAHEQEESASGSNFFFEGTSIYSYGHHFEVGRIVKNKQGKKAYLINEDYYSVTTSKHQCYVRNAIPTWAMVFSVGDNISDTGNMRFVASKLESIKKSIEKYKRAKTELSYTDIWGAFGNMMDYIQFFNMGTAKSILKKSANDWLGTNHELSKSGDSIKRKHVHELKRIFQIHSISVSADWFSATGKALSSENRLLLEVPEYITFKDGEVLSNKDGSYIFILNTHGKYLTSFYASLNQKGILKIEDGLSAWENQIEKYRFATKSERQKLVDALKASKEPEAKEYLKRFFGIEEKPKYEFKPFDKVLVRKEGNKKWNISLFAREIVDDYNGLPYKYECSNGTLWDYCIHFEGNEHLLGTNKNG